LIRNTQVLGKILRIRPKVIIHIGAHYGQDKANYKNIGANKIYWGEPNPDALQFLTRNFPDDNFISKPFWSKPDESITFYLTEHSEQSSLIEPLDQNAYTEVTLTSTTLDKEFPSLSSSFKTMLVMDVQGAEIEVLLGGTRTLPNIKYLVVEIANRNQGYKKTPSKFEVETILSEHKFKRILERPSYDHSYSDVLYMKTNFMKANALTLIDLIFLYIMKVRHILKYKHQPRDAFHCESCNV